MNYIVLTCGTPLLPGTGIMFIIYPIHILT